MERVGGEGRGLMWEVEGGGGWGEVSEGVKL